MDFEIKFTWDGRPIDHHPVQFHLERDGDAIRVEINAPFFNDTPVPTGEAGKPFNKLWDYEVAEIFFLGAEDRYLEAEFSPHGQHLLLLLSGKHNVVQMCLPLKYTAQIEGVMWRGTAMIPLSYFPAEVNRLNAYAIHGTGHERQYESLFPNPPGQFSNPDFHRLEFFRQVEFGDIFSPNESLSELWVAALQVEEKERLKCEKL